MAKFILASILIFGLGCSKHENDSSNMAEGRLPAWLEAKKAGYSNCSCLWEFWQATYLGQTVFEIRLVDARCLGVSQVYDSSGINIFLSGNDAYKAYRAQARNITVLWSCKEGDMPDNCFPDFRYAQGQ